MVVTRAAAKRIVGPQGKRKLAPPPPILQIMILKLSPPRCVISKESVQQKWIDELWFRKQLSTCLFLWTFNYNSCAPGHHSVRTPSQWAWSPPWLGLPLPILEYLITNDHGYVPFVVFTPSFPHSWLPTRFTTRVHPRLFAQFLVYCVVFVLFFGYALFDLRVTASDNHFGIFKLFL
jgi:hypothetical protein